MISLFCCKEFKTNTAAPNHLFLMRQYRRRILKTIYYNLMKFFLLKIFFLNLMQKREKKIQYRKKSTRYDASQKPN